MNRPFGEIAAPEAADGEQVAKSEPRRSAFLLRQGFGIFGRGLRAGSQAVLGLLYPPSCVGCGAATADTQALCAACWAGLAFIEKPYCERLGTPFAADFGEGMLSPAAIADPPAFGRARAVCRFDGVARELVHRLKYGDRADLALPLARMMRLAGRELLAQADLVAPIPLHRTRLWSRRFNQSALLARELCRLADKPHAPDLLVRRRRTRPQAGLTRPQRAENLQGALRVREGRSIQVEGRRILLIDDVLTTGATANAAARALLKAGAAGVDVLTFARVVTEA